MKKLLLILLCLPMIGFGQTLMPDANFEQAYNILIDKNIAIKNKDSLVNCI